MQEFRTTIAGQGADMGHTAGGQVALVTKSGSNSFHGSLYEFNRNTDFEANDWFSNRAGVARPALIRNQYGVSLAGPIKKNKLFFFYNWEGRKDRSQAATTANVPSNTFKEGIVKVLLKSGTDGELTPSQVQAIDPLGIGENPYILNLLQQYPAGNDPLRQHRHGLELQRTAVQRSGASEQSRAGREAGLQPRQRWQVHTISIRGTLNGASMVNSGTQFPGTVAGFRYSG